ncbi:MAG: class I SAM-dependent methyltransferase [Thermonemataceae bacterium]|nr:class I SAM-dependent methyltransferase [Thermonemataceae bacterium]
MPCLFCNSTKNKVSVYEDTYFNGKLFAYKQCKSCSLVYLSPLPIQEDYVAMYPVSYQAEIKTKSNGSYDKLLQQIASLSNNHHILDYGCGNGRFVVEALAAQFQVTATEFSPTLVQNLQTEIPNARFFTIEDFKSRTEKYDIIFLSNVLEHLSNPQEIMQMLYEKLEAGGLMVLEGPVEHNFSLAASFRKIIFATRKFLFKKQAHHVPYHIFYANAKNQKVFLERLGLQTLSYQIEEQPWPFPASWQGAQGFKNKVLYLIARLSISLSKLNSNWGNIFIYIGRKK